MNSIDHNMVTLAAPREVAADQQQHHHQHDQPYPHQHQHNPSGDYHHHHQHHDQSGVQQPYQHDHQTFHHTHQHEQSDQNLHQHDQNDHHNYQSDQPYQHQHDHQTFHHHHQHGQSADHHHQHDQRYQHHHQPEQSGDQHHQHDQNDDHHHHQHSQSGDQQQHQHDQTEAAATTAASVAARRSSLWQICPFLCQVSCPSSPEGSSVRCMKCQDSDQQFNDLGSTYNHLKKHHPQQFQRLYKQWKSDPPPPLPKRRAPYAYRPRKSNGSRTTPLATTEEEEQRAHVSVKVELEEKALVDPSNLFSGNGPQFCSENDPTLSSSSAVWCAGLFQRHNFRNGTTGALCLECGQVLWELGTDAQLMDHIVNKHPEYMPNMAASTATEMAPTTEGQIAPTYVDEQGELWQCLDVATNGESAEEMFRRHGARPVAAQQPQQQLMDHMQNDQQQQKLLLECAFGGGSLLCGFRAIWIGHQRAIFLSIGHNHAMSAEQMPMKVGLVGSSTSPSAAESVMETIERVLQQDHSTHVDVAGKEWQWLADVSPLGDEAELRRVCRANDLYREGSARNFSCKWSSRNARSPHSCPLRGLYVPERSALFHRHNHNHPVPMVNNSSTKVMVQQQQQQQTVEPPKGSDYVDRRGNAWQLLAEIPTKSELVTVCRANGLVQNGPRNVAGKSYFGCQRAKSGRPSGGTAGGADGGLCPYRALYVSKRRAIFHRLAHNHEHRPKWGEQLTHC